MREVVQHKIGGVMLVAESAAAQTWQELALLCGTVTLVMTVLVMVEHFVTGDRDE